MDAKTQPRKTLATLVSLGCFALICLYSLPKLLSSHTETTSPTPPSASTFFLGILFIATLLLCILALAVRSWSKRSRPTLKATKLPEGPFTRRGTLPVGRGRVHLIEVRGRTFLVATDAAGLQSMVALQGPVAVEEPAPAPSQQPEQDQEPAIVIAQRVRVHVPIDPEQRGKIDL